MSTLKEAFTAKQTVNAALKEANTKFKNVLADTIQAKKEEVESHLQAIQTSNEATSLKVKRLLTLGYSPKAGALSHPYNIKDTLVNEAATKYCEASEALAKAFEDFEDSKVLLLGTMINSDTPLYIGQFKPVKGTTEDSIIRLLKEG